MNKPILYYDDRSPPVRSVLLLIDELQLDVDLVFIDLFKREHVSNDYLKISPIHTVPALKHGDLILTDSHAILIYLVDVFAKGHSLLPDDNITRIKIINKLFFSGTVLFRRDSDAMTQIILEEPTDITHHLKKLKDVYSSMERFLNQSKFMACDHVTIADLSVVATLSTVDQILPVKEQDFPLLGKWFTNMKQRPSYNKANLIGLNKLVDIIRNKIKFVI